MGLRQLSGLLGGVAVLLATGLSHAQCSKDTDCKGDRICEAGACVTPEALPPAPVAPQAVAPVSDSAPAPAASADPVAPRMVDSTEVEPAKPKMQRHSTGMMVGGIVMTSMAPVALLISLIADTEQNSCEGGWPFTDDTNEEIAARDCSRYDKTIYGGLIVGGVLLSAGIPMIVIGGKKEPVGTATLNGWVSPQGGGLGLRLDL